MVRLAPQYSAAYRSLGQSYAPCERRAEAHDIFARRIAVAEARGDLQTAKEMQVCLRRRDTQTS